MEMTKWIQKKKIKNKHEMKWNKRKSTYKLIMYSKWRINRNFFIIIIFGCEVAERMKERKCDNSIMTNLSGRCCWDFEWLVILFIQAFMNWCGQWKSKTQKNGSERTTIDKFSIVIIFIIVSITNRGHNIGNSLSKHLEMVYYNIHLK